MEKRAGTLGHAGGDGKREKERERGKAGRAREEVGEAGGVGAHAWKSASGISFSVSFVEAPGRGVVCEMCGAVAKARRWREGDAAHARRVSLPRVSWWCRSPRVVVVSRARAAGAILKWLLVARCAFWGRFAREQLRPAHLGEWRGALCVPGPYAGRVRSSLAPVLLLLELDRAARLRLRRAGMRIRYPWNFSRARLGV
jgi:hypothetical protein